MSITTLNELVNALGNSAITAVINKASISNVTAGAFTSLWRATGTPGQGAIPTTAAVCNKTFTGALANFTNPTGGQKVYIGKVCMASGNTAPGIAIADRLCHMGGLSGTSIVQQTVNLTLTGVGTGRYAADFSDIQWFLEWYTDTGATASNATVNVTYGDDTSENLALIAVGGTVRAARMLPLIPATAGKYIKAVNHITLSASTTAAGNFGVTAYRCLSDVTLGLANSPVNFDWAALGLPNVPSDACLSMIMVSTTTTSGSLIGNAKLITG